MSATMWKLVGGPATGFSRNCHQESAKNHRNWLSVARSKAKAGDCGHGRRRNCNCNCARVRNCCNGDTGRQRVTPRNPNPLAKQGSQPASQDGGRRQDTCRSPGNPREPLGTSESVVLLTVAASVPIFQILFPRLRFAVVGELRFGVHTVLYMEFLCGSFGGEKSRPLMVYLPVFILTHRKWAKLISCVGLSFFLFENITLYILTYRSYTRFGPWE